MLTFVAIKNHKTLTHYETKFTQTNIVGDSGDVFYGRRYVC